MKALIIYDLNGHVWNMLNESEIAPPGLPSLIVDIPDKAILEKIDLTDIENPAPVFSYPPESDFIQLQIKTTNLEKNNAIMRQELDSTKYNLSITQEELTNTQLALTELYESNL